MVACKRFWFLALQFLWFNQTEVVTIDCSGQPQINIRGSGSTAPQQYIGDIAASYTVNRSLTRGLKLNMSYDATSTSRGMTRLRGNDTSGNLITIYALGASFFPNDRSPYPEIALAPVVGGATVFVFNLPGISSLNLSVPILTQIFMGQIDMWNDSSIQSLNPNIQLPSANIVVAARRDVVDQTNLVTSLFSAYSDVWNSKYHAFSDPLFAGGKCCNSTSWPPNVIMYWANQNFGMVTLASSITYMIGYVFQGLAAQNAVPIVSLVNRLGYVIYPSPSSIQAAMSYWGGVYPNLTSYRIMDAPTAGAYPLVSFYYVAVDFDTMANVSCCQQREFVGFLNYLVSMPQNKDIALKYSFATVFDNLSTAVTTQILNRVYCNGDSMYQAFMDTFQTSLLLPDYGIALIVVACLLAASSAVTVVCVWRYQHLTNEKHWLIPSGLLDLNRLAAHSTSMSSFASDKSSRSTTGEKLSKSSIPRTQDKENQFPFPQTVMDDKAVMLVELTVKRPKHWRTDTRQLTFRCTQKLSHAGIAHFFGITVIGTKVFAVQESMLKGTLHFVLKTTGFEFTDSIKMSIATDVAEGLSYLHSRGIIVGHLNSLCVFVTANWSIKIANWMSYAIWSGEDRSYIDFLYRFDKQDLQREKCLIELLYLHPQAMKSGKFTAQSDVFSFGILMAEILNGSTPYSYEVEQTKSSYYKILKNKTEFQQQPVPEIRSPLASRLLDRICSACINEQYLDFISVLQELRMDRQHSGAGGSLTDVLMETMEALIGDMEKKTADLEKVSQKMKELLNEVLPPSVAEKLFLGQSVAPELFESVSVFFSDVCGFAEIALKSSPLEVMTFLNDIWTLFDSVIELFDCYKVDAIGDSYMVCSGLPKRNGVTHVKHIADLALTLRRRTATYVVKNLPDEKAVIRVGINSGPVTTGVVGTKMPQFCVFGDTVNTAARMEQTGIQGKIQCSELTANMLVSNYGTQYKLERRGEVEIKVTSTS